MSKRTKKKSRKAQLDFTYTKQHSHHLPHDEPDDIVDNDDEDDHELDDGLTKKKQQGKKKIKKPLQQHHNNNYNNTTATTTTTVQQQQQQQVWTPVSSPSTTLKRQFTTSPLSTVLQFSPYHNKNSSKQQATTPLTTNTTTTTSTTKTTTPVPFRNLKDFITSPSYSDSNVTSGEIPDFYSSVESLNIDCNNTVTTAVEELQGKLIAIALGKTHSLSLTSKGCVYVSGCGENGQLGLDSVLTSEIPMQIQFSEPISSIACGEFHCLALSIHGSVWSWGSNKFGQLGHDDLASRSTPTIIETLGDFYVVHIACGAEHSAAITDDVRVWTWGNGKQGRLGHGDEISSSVPTQVQFPSVKEEDVTYSRAYVSCGSYHTMAALWIGEEDEEAVEGAVFATGAGRFTPKVLWSLTDDFIHSLACGAHNTLLLNRLGNVFSTGLDWDEQPEMVLEGLDVVQLACGRNLSAAITREGKVYRWNDSEQPQIYALPDSYGRVPVAIACKGDELFVVSATSDGEKSFASVANKSNLNDTDMSWKRGEDSSIEVGAEANDYSERQEAEDNSSDGKSDASNISIDIDTFDRSSFPESPFDSPSSQRSSLSPSPHSTKIAKSPSQASTPPVSPHSSSSSSSSPSPPPSIAGQLKRPWSRPRNVKRKQPETSSLPVFTTPSVLVPDTPSSLPVSAISHHTFNVSGTPYTPFRPAAALQATVLAPETPFVTPHVQASNHSFNVSGTPSSPYTVRNSRTPALLQTTVLAPETPFVTPHIQASNHSFNISGTPVSPYNPTPSPNVRNSRTITPNPTPFPPLYRTPVISPSSPEFSPRSASTPYRPPQTASRTPDSDSNFIPNTPDEYVGNVKYYTGNLSSHLPEMNSFTLRFEYGSDERNDAPTNLSSPPTKKHKTDVIPASLSPVKTQLAPSKIKNVVVMFDGLTEEIKSNLSEKITTLSGRVSVGSSFHPDITHVVSPSGNVGLVLLAGVVTSRWIVDPQWIHESANQGFFVDESSHGKRVMLPVMGKKFYVVKDSFAKELQRLANSIITILKLGRADIVESGEGADYVVGYDELPTQKTDAKVIRGWAAFTQFILALLI